MKACWTCWVVKGFYYQSQLILHEAGQARFTKSEVECRCPDSTPFAAAYLCSQRVCHGFLIYILLLAGTMHNKTRAFSWHAHVLKTVWQDQTSHADSPPYQGSKMLNAYKYLDAQYHEANLNLLKSRQPASSPPASARPLAPLRGTCYGLDTKLGHVLSK